MTSIYNIFKISTVLLGMNKKEPILLDDTLVETYDDLPLDDQVNAFISDV